MLRSRLLLYRPPPLIPAKEKGRGENHGKNERIAALPNVCQVLSKHVKLEIACVDRLYLAASIPISQTSSQLIQFLVKNLGKPIAGLLSSIS